MTKKLFPIFLVVCFLIILSSVSYAAGLELDVDTNKETVTVSGTTASHSNISIYVEGEDGKRAYINQIKADGDGFFTLNFTLEDGNYILNVTSENGATQSRNLTVLSSPSEVIEKATVFIYIKGYDGVILPKTEVEIDDGDTVEDVIERVLDDEGISYVNRGGYIESIDGQAEYDRGPGSGWMFSVNGVFPDESINSVEVSDGDYIKFLYTENLGEDIGNKYEGEIDLGEKLQSAMDEAERIINDPDADENDLADAINTVTDSLIKETENIKTSDDAELITYAASNFAEMIEKADERVESEGAAEKLAESSVKLVETLAESAEKAISEETKRKIKETTDKALNTTLKIMEKMIEESKLKEVAENLIKSVAKIQQVVIEEDVNAIKAKTIKIAQKAIERAGTDRITEDEIIIEGTKAKAYINSERLAQKAAIVIDMAGEIDSKLQENKIIAHKELEKKVSIEVAAAEGTDEVEINIPGEVIETVSANNINKMEIKSVIAEFSLTYNTFDEAVRGKDISLGARKVPEEELSDAAKKQLPNETIVIDLNAEVGGQKVVRFNEPIEVAVPYILKEEDAPESITAFLLKDDGTLEPVGGKYDVVTGKVRFWTNHFSKYLANPSVGEFADLLNYSWAKKPVEILAGKGIISGRAKNVFDPSGDITRAEFAALLVRMLKLNKSSEEIPFNDVAKDAWYSDAVAAAYDNGIVNGKNEKEFDPNGKIRRQEIAVMIARILEKHGYKPAEDEALKKFNDKDAISQWAKKGAALVVREGIINGMGNEKFVPKGNTTRAQAAVILYRVFDLLL